MKPLLLSITIWLTKIVIAVALPICLIAANTWYITNSDWLYSYGWWRNNIPQRTGISVEQLNQVANQIKRYFNDDTEFLTVSAIQNGSQVDSLYNERETLHMRDVKTLMLLVRNTAIVTGAVCLMLLASIVLALRSKRLSVINSALLLSTIIAITFIGTLTVIMSINFNWIFTQFHILSFANDLWLLNPRTDVLIQMFPTRFFFEAALFIGTLTVIQYMALLIGVKILRRMFTRSIPPQLSP